MATELKLPEELEAVQYSSIGRVKVSSNRNGNEWGLSLTVGELCRGQLPLQNSFTLVTKFDSAPLCSAVVCRNDSSTFLLCYFVVPLFDWMLSE